MAGQAQTQTVVDQPILLKVLLRQHHWQTYGTFCREYDKAAKQVDPCLMGKWPSRTQLHRWLSGDLKGLPYSDHCRVLEAMFPGKTAEELFAPVTAEVPAPRQAPSSPAPDIGGQFADVTAVFSSRSAFAAAYPPSALFDNAKEISAAGLSLNLLCQSYPDHQLKRLLEGGTHIRCLFLDPHGTAIKEREAEERYTDSTLSTLTALNISILTRLKGRLDPQAAKRLEIAVYDETIRFNILIMDRATCVVQPYLPQARGVDSPTFVITDNTAAEGLFPVFDQIFTSLWERSRPV
ncbi:DUF5919 domain-containing protein [Planomonospora venezuelensis]|uniref:DUF5919 domain-containing protein n=1 Tax=Planomonospora venezuelensis TaxID=1999 RepID=A0A841CVR1_PLAVE|nr:DUF5919 domain-containing protein [Planomonospora venezuelensis]MBB5960923.1 hypothetical protein [Planomonospora venezuelensis]GIN01158.1 hypothetical protein Pve01_28160 [Planomonospora venezuelensis]